MSRRPWIPASSLLKPRAVIFDYGAGNLHSLARGLETGGATVRIEANSERLTRDTDAIVLPGVGSWKAAAPRLTSALLSIRAAVDGGLPLLGICLGMQLLFDSSDEGDGSGLGILKGRVTKLNCSRVPHMGWNSIEYEYDHGDLAGSGRLGVSSDLSMAYFANSYVAHPEDADLKYVVAWCGHESQRFPAIVQRRNVVGVQFHPEKSGTPGLNFLRDFLFMAAAARRVPC